MTHAYLVAAVLLGLGAAHLLYTYVAYPWLVSRLPVRAPRPSRPDRTSPRQVSIVIATRGGGEAGPLMAKVRDLLRTVQLPCEVIVVLDGTDRELLAELQALEDPRVKIEALPVRTGKAGALNRAVELARGEVLVFSDARQGVGRCAVEELVSALASPDVGAVSGAVALATRGRKAGLYERYWQFERQLRAREAAWDSAVGVSGALYALKRELWSPLPQGLLLDDVWVPMQVIRAGKRVGFASRAIATDAGAGSDAGELARKVRTLTGNYQLLAWMPSLLNPLKNRIWWQFMSHKVMRLLTPLAALCVVTGGLLLAVTSKGAGAAAVAGAVGAAVLILAWAAKPGGSRAHPGVGVRGTIRSALVLLVALVVAAANAIRGRWDVWSEVARPRLES